MIEDILGFDHKTFAQIVYQSNASSLEFLTSADTARKKFLIEILNLGRYTHAQEVFKQISQDLAKEIAQVQTQVNTVTSWLAKYEKTDLNLRDFVTVTPLNQEQLTNVAALETTISGIEQTNKKISQNNTYKQLQAKISLVPIPQQPSESIEPLQAEVATLTKTITDADAFVKKMRALHGTCPTCLSQIDDAKVQELVSEKQKESEDSNFKKLDLNTKIIGIRQAKQLWQQAIETQKEWEKYHQLIDADMPDALLDKDSLAKQLSELKAEIEVAQREIKRAEAHNRDVSAHNSKVELISKQLVEMNEELEIYSGKLEHLSNKMNLLNILNKTFSTTGLVAYKIECLVKDLEDITNKYLVDLSDGRFQISFKVSASDKLNVIITDNGKDIEIAALSGGEKARVNVATLLAIRKLMQTLSSSLVS